MIRCSVEWFRDYLVPRADKTLWDGKPASGLFLAKNKYFSMGTRIDRALEISSGERGGFEVFPEFAVLTS